MATFRNLDINYIKCNITGGADVLKLVLNGAVVWQLGTSYSKNVSATTSFLSNGSAYVGSGSYNIGTGCRRVSISPIGFHAQSPACSYNPDTGVVSYHIYGIKASTTYKATLKWYQ